MTRRMWSACALVLALAAPGAAGAGEVQLTFKDGRVALVARDATLREILLEWERVGGTRIVNRDRAPGTRLSLDMVDVPEAQALATLLRSAAGYMASRRVGPGGGASGFSRIVLMPGEATPLSYAAAGPAQSPARTGTSSPSGTEGPQGTGGPPFGRPGMQRRVLPDGRVVTVMTDDAQRADQDDEPDDPAPANAPGVMRPPFNAPRPGQGQAPGDAYQPEVQPGQALPGTSPTPGAPPTVAVPGALPGQKVPPAPPKPPGD